MYEYNDISNRWMWHVTPPNRHVHKSQGLQYFSCTPRAVVLDGHKTQPYLANLLVSHFPLYVKNSRKMGMGLFVVHPTSRPDEHH